MASQASSFLRSRDESSGFSFERSSTEPLVVGIGDVEEQRLGSAGKEQLVGILLDGGLIHPAPVERLVGRPGVFPVRCGSRLTPSSSCGTRQAGGGHGGGGDVETDDRMLEDLSARDRARPGGDKGHADAAFAEHAFLAAHGQVDASRPRDCVVLARVDRGQRRAVVAEEEDQRVFLFAHRAELSRMRPTPSSMAAIRARAERRSFGRCSGAFEMHGSGHSSGVCGAM